MACPLYGCGVPQIQALTVKRIDYKRIGNFFRLNSDHLKLTNRQTFLYTGLGAAAFSEFGSPDIPDCDPGSTGGKNGVGILVDRELVVEVRRVNDRLMSIKLVVGGFTVNVISAYAPQVGLDQEVKKQFWEDLDEMVHSIPHIEKLFIGGDFNGHIGASARGDDDVHDGYGFGDRNGGGNSLLDFARAFDLVIANSSFPKREEHLVTFRNSMGKTQIDYLLCRKCDKGLCTDCKVIPSEHLTTLHRLLVMDLEIKRSRRKREGCR
ncbi:PREDICTED: craniofacial development protein 2-like [Nicotiana attenuata]|uniref:craniofacial development protein 2-like n=1 Tax=Nicotiana attenuata TaxID=49451 RepID=UPI00090571D2|nr:PREDICTED: craniofacial development protein 2-like [Nicotiana attenuata]